MAKSKMIDLGVSSGEYQAPAFEAKTKESKHYPTLYIKDIEELHDLPDGEFKFMCSGKLISHTEETSKDGEDHCSCEIEVHSMSPMGAVEDEGDEADAGLDNALEEISEKKKK